VKKRGKQQKTEYQLGTTTVKIGRDLRNHIFDKSVKGESIDQAIRRLLGFPNGGGKGASS